MHTQCATLFLEQISPSGISRIALTFSLSGFSLFSQHVTYVADFTLANLAFVSGLCFSFFLTSSVFVFSPHQNVTHYINNSFHSFQMLRQTPLGKIPKGSLVKLHLPKGVLRVWNGHLPGGSARIPDLHPPQKISWFWAFLQQLPQVF